MSKVNFSSVYAKREDSLIRVPKRWRKASRQASYTKEAYWSSFSAALIISGCAARGNLQTPPLPLGPASELLLVTSPATAVASLRPILQACTRKVASSHSLRYSIADDIVFKDSRRHRLMWVREKLQLASQTLCSQTRYDVVLMWVRTEEQTTVRHRL